MSRERYQQVRRLELEDGDLIPHGAEVLDSGITGDSIVVWIRGPEHFHAEGGDLERDQAIAKALDVATDGGSHE